MSEKEMSSPPAKRRLELEISYSDNSDYDFGINVDEIDDIESDIDSPEMKAIFCVASGIAKLFKTDGLSLEQATENLSLNQMQLSADSRGNDDLLKENRSKLIKLMSLGNVELHSGITSCRAIAEQALHPSFVEHGAQILEEWVNALGKASIKPVVTKGSEELWKAVEGQTDEKCNWYSAYQRILHSRTKHEKLFHQRAKELKEMNGFLDDILTGIQSNGEGDITELGPFEEELSRMLEDSNLFHDIQDESFGNISLASSLFQGYFTEIDKNFHNWESDCRCLPADSDDENELPTIDLTDESYSEFPLLDEDD